MEKYTAKAVLALAFLSLALNIATLLQRWAAAAVPNVMGVPALQAVGTYQASCAYSGPSGVSIWCHVIDTRTGEKVGKF